MEEEVNDGCDASHCSTCSVMLKSANEPPLKVTLQACASIGPQYHEACSAVRVQSAGQERQEERAVSLNRGLPNIEGLYSSCSVPLGKVQAFSGHYWLCPNFKWAPSEERANYANSPHRSGSPSMFHCSKSRCPTCCPKRWHSHIPRCCNCRKNRPVV